MTWLSVLSREIASSNPRNDAFVIWVSHCPLVAGAPRCHQRMPAINFDKRKVSPLNIDFIDVRIRMDTEPARTFLTVITRKLHQRR